MDEQMPTLAAVLAQVPDLWAARGRRHPRPALLVLSVVGLVSGVTSQRALARWGRVDGLARRRHLGFTPRRSPSQATLYRVLCQVDVVALEADLDQWLQQVRAAWRRSAARWRGPRRNDRARCHERTRHGRVPPGPPAPDRGDDHLRCPLHPVDGRRAGRPGRRRLPDGRQGQPADYWPTAEPSPPTSPVSHTGCSAAPARPRWPMTAHAPGRRGHGDRLAVSAAGPATPAPPDRQAHRRRAHR
jgi:DDE family transposase